MLVTSMMMNNYKGMNKSFSPNQVLKIQYQKRVIYNYINKSWTLIMMGKLLYKTFKIFVFVILYI